MSPAVRDPSSQSEPAPNEPVITRLPVAGQSTRLGSGWVHPGPLTSVAAGIRSGEISSVPEETTYTPSAESPTLAPSVPASPWISRPELPE